MLSVGYSTTHVANASDEPILVTVNRAFAIIPKGAVVGFTASGTVFISISSESLGNIWHEVPQEEDKSFIVKSNGVVTRARYGTIWTED